MSQASFGGLGDQTGGTALAVVPSAPQRPDVESRLQLLTTAVVDAGADLVAVGRHVARTALDLFGDTAVLWLLAPDGRTLDPVGSADRDRPRHDRLVRLLATTRPRTGVGLVGGAATSGRVRVHTTPVPVDRALDRYPAFLHEEGLVSLVTAPLALHGRVLGVLLVGRDDSSPRFDEARVPDVELFASGIPAVLERARLLADAARAQALLDSLSPAVIATDPQRRVTSWNLGAERLYRITAEQALGQRLDHLVRTLVDPDPDAESNVPELDPDDARWHVVTHDGEWSGQVRQSTGDGGEVEVELRVTLLAGRDGKVTGGITLAREVADGERDPIAADVSHDSQAVIDALGNDLAVLDRFGNVLATNLGWERRSQEPAEQLGAWVPAEPGDDYVRLLRTAGRDRPPAREALAGLEGVLDGRLSQFDMDYDASVSGDDRFYGMTVSPLGDRCGGVVVQHHDVTWRKTLERQLSHRATHDALTGLPNRMLLTDRLTQALVRARRSGRLVAVMFVDLDQFKAVNDTLGHAAGDQVLVAVSRRLLRACRASDSVTRFGGDEFVLVVEDVDTVQNVRRIAQRVLDSMTAPVVVDGAELYFGASIGVAVAGSEQVTAETVQVDDLLRDADTAMYRAKEGGRNQYVVFEPGMRERVAARLSLTTSLRHAVDRAELRLLYQPQLDCLDGHVTGAEALLRWEHPERGLLLPAEFIEVAEDSGVIVEIGAWVLDEACRQAAQWQDRAPGFTVHVNLSPRQVADPNVVALVRHALDRHGLEPARLGLEITEGALMDDPETAARTLEQLRDLGVRIAVDDFGTGYSSLAYLQRFPVDILKIDRFFVARVPDDPTTTALVRGIVSLADALGLGTVAEGVETEAQRAAVLGLGCSSFQGFLVARPSPPDVVTALLAAPRPDGPPRTPVLHVV